MCKAMSVSAYTLLFATQRYANKPKKFHYKKRRVLLLPMDGAMFIWDSYEAKKKHTHKRTLRIFPFYIGAHNGIT